MQTVPLFIKYQVYYSLPSGGADYATIMMTPVGFMSGDALGTTACLNVTVIDDNAVEMNETFTISASNVDPAVIIAPLTQADITIFDNDGKSELWN